MSISKDATAKLQEVSKESIVIGLSLLAFSGYCYKAKQAIDNDSHFSIFYIFAAHMPLRMISSSINNLSGINLEEKLYDKVSSKIIAPIAKYLNASNEVENNIMAPR